MPEARDNGNYFTRSLYSMVPASAVSAGLYGYSYALQADARRPQYSNLVKKLQSMGKSGAMYGMPEDLKFYNMDVSKNPYTSPLNPFTSAHYNPQTKTVQTAQRGTRPDAGLLAHELGHARQYADPRYKGFNKLAGLSRGASMFSTLPLMFADSPDTAKKATTATTIAGLPVFAQEVDASLKGRWLLSQAAKQSGQKLGLMGQLAPFKGVPSYLLALALPYITYKYLSAKEQY